MDGGEANDDDNVWLSYADDTDSQLERLLEHHMEDLDHVVSEWHSIIII